MTLTEFGRQRGFIVSTKKGFCPFHQDRSPSAMWNANGVYCFTCLRTYSFIDVARKFHVHLDYDHSEESGVVKSLHELPQNPVLFTYPWLTEEERNGKAVVI